MNRSFLFKKFIFPSSKESKMVGVLGILGVFIGVFSIILVVSVMKGFEKRLIDRIVGNETHILIYDKEDIVIDSETIDEIDALNMKGIKAKSLFIETETVFYMDKTTSGGIIFAANNDFIKHRLKQDYLLKEGEAFIGKELATRNALFIDDKFDALSLWDVVAKVSIPKLASLKVKGLVRTGNFAKDASYIYLNINDALKYFTPIPDMANGIAILLNNPMEVDSYAKILKKEFPKLKIETWKTRNKAILFSLKIERALMFVVLLFVLLIASFAVLGSIVLDLESRKRDFALLVSLGLSQKRLKKLILNIAFSRSFIGSVAGGIVASIFCVLLEKYKFIHLPIIYYDPILPIDFHWSLAIGISVFGVLVGVLGSTFSIRNIKLPLISRIK